MKRIILASASPRRRELLTQLGLQFDVAVSDADEAFDKHLSAEQNVMRIASGKAKAVASQIDGDCLIIGADTVVCCGETVLTKPPDEQSAFGMLRMLSGRTHTVYTGFAVLRTSDFQLETGCEQTQVTFRDLTDEDIAGYIKTGEPMDKAGGYGVQGIGAVLVRAICGDYSNVVGLPLGSLAQTLGKFGIKILSSK